MATEVGVLEARNNLSTLIKLARSGHDITITSRQVPQVRLVPVESAPEKGSPPTILAAVRASVHRGRSQENLDAMIEAERNSWE